MASKKVNTTSEVGIHDSVLGGTLLGINFFIILLNVLAIMVIVRFRHKNAIDIFVLTLAMTDLLKGLIPVPMSIYIYMTDAYLKVGTPGCDFFGWIAFFTNSAAMLILTLMAIERFWAVVKPFAYKRWVTTRKVQIVSAVAMLITAFQSALPVIGVGRMLPYNDGAYSHFDYSQHSRGTMAYSIFIISYGFGMIGIVMVAYGFVFYKIRDLIHRHRKLSAHRKHGSKSPRGLNLKTEKMFSYLTVALMILFWFSWLPFLMVVTASQLGVDIPFKNLDLFAIRIAVVNSMLNPLACAALCKPYRRGILFYLRVMCSYAGFQRPDSDIWDPWRRGTASTVRRNTRKAKENEDRADQRIRSLTDMGGSSLTDSMVPTDYQRHRLPSDLETYESYRQKRRESVPESKKEETKEERRLSTLPEIHHEIGLQDSNLQIYSQQPTASSSRSIDSGIDGSPDTPHTKQVEEGSSSDHSKRICTNAKDILAGNLETERQDNKDHNKNCIRTEEDSSEASPGQRRKLMLLDRVQKYLGSKRETADLRNSLELLRSSIASERDPLICPEDMESPVNNNDVFSKGFEHNKEISFVKNLNTQKTADLSEKESETSDCLKIKTDVDEKRKSQSCSNIPDFVNNYPYGGSGMRDSCGEARPRSYCDKIINKNIRNMYRDSIIDSTRSSVIDGRKGELESETYVTRPRCFSEGDGSDVYTSSNFKGNGSTRDLDVSINMIDSITKELLDFSETSLHLVTTSTHENTPNKYERNTIYF